MLMKESRFKGALGAVIVGGLMSSLLVPTASAHTPIKAAAPKAAPQGVVIAAGPLSDLSPDTIDPTDGASAWLVSVVHPGKGTSVKLKLKGLSSSAAGVTFGAHVHNGPCVSGEPKVAGPHFNTGGAPSRSTEVWLDFKISSSGRAKSRASVPFTIAAGDAKSVVIHQLPTNPSDGSAGSRLACLPVLF